MSNQLYITSNQYHKLYKLKDKVDVIITDSPIILGIIYNKFKGKKKQLFNELIIELFNDFENHSLNYLILRDKPYNSKGRAQTEEESDEIAEQIEELLHFNNIPYTEYLGNIFAYDRIIDEITLKLSKIKEIKK